ncbi:recombinase family protein [Vibrio splendidus]
MWLFVECSYFDTRFYITKLDRSDRSYRRKKHHQSAADKGVNVVCLDLPVADLSSAEGKLMPQMFSVFAKFERKIKAKNGVDLKLTTLPAQFRLKKQKDYHSVKLLKHLVWGLPQLKGIGIRKSK